MKNLNEFINEALTKNIPNNSPLISVIQNVVEFDGRGVSKYINIDAVNDDYETFKDEIKKLSLYKSTWCKLDNTAIKAALVILAQAKYSNNKSMENEITSIAQKYFSSNLKVHVGDFVNNYYDAEGNLNIVISCNNSARIQMGIYLDGFVAKRYKTTSTKMGLDIHYDEYDGESGDFIDRGIKNKVKIDL